MAAILNDSLIAGGDETSDQLAAAFASVASRHAGRDLDIEPVGVELVEAALEVTLGLPATDSLGRRRMVRTIAETLLEDEVARARLNDLWRRLSGTKDVE